jgi:hypothetical protein
VNERIGRDAFPRAALRGRTARLAALAAVALSWALPCHALADRPEPVAVHYTIPVEAPRGHVHVLSFGIAELPLGGPRALRRFVHVRLAAHNELDETPWTLDARAQALVLPGGRRVAARFAEAGPGVAPALVILRRGERGYLDLFFPMHEPRDPPWTALAWVVRRVGLVTVASTVFQRLSNGEAPYEYYGPSHHAGGAIIVGAAWCHPGHWHSGWLSHYAGYGGYRHHRRRGGVDVVHGDRVWRGDDAHAPGGQETVGTRWRRALPSPAFAGDRTADDRGSDRSASVGRSWRSADGVGARWTAPPAPASRPDPPPSYDPSPSSGRESSGSSSGRGGSDAPSESVGSRWRALR